MCLRAKLALFAAAAAVFAPGWGASDAMAKTRASSELAGRILAPTFHEASARGQIENGSYKPLERAKPRPVSHNVLAWRTSATPTAPPKHLWVAAVAALVLMPLRRAPAFRSPRAPPHLLTV